MHFKHFGEKREWIEVAVCVCGVGCVCVRAPMCEYVHVALAMFVATQTRRESLNQGFQ